jgi:hypothetical protein
MLSSLKNAKKNASGKNREGVCLIALIGIKHFPTPALSGSGSRVSGFNSPDLSRKGHRFEQTLPSSTPVLLTNMANYTKNVKGDKFSFCRSGAVSLLYIQKSTVNTYNAQV